jgi:hypothetical protein
MEINQFKYLPTGYKRVDRGFCRKTDIVRWLRTGIYESVGPLEGKTIADCERIGYNVYRCPIKAKKKSTLTRRKQSLTRASI